MLYTSIANALSGEQAVFLAAFISFLLTFLLLGKRFDFLPRDHGRNFAVNGALSKGKLRGVGVLMVPAFSVAALIFCPLSLEFVLYLVLMNLMMLSGYLDDASKIPWTDYKKGAIDFVIAAATMLVFVLNNETTISFFSWSVTLPKAVYFILGIVLLWAAVNVTNCSDGVDGLCATLTIVTLGSFMVVFKEGLGQYFGYTAVFIGMILAYLYFNCSPSSMLMGDAGSRTFGYFIALVAMKSGHPLSYLLLSLILILDRDLYQAKTSVDAGQLPIMPCTSG